MCYYGMCYLPYLTVPPTLQKLYSLFTAEFLVVDEEGGVTPLDLTPEDVNLLQNSCASIQLTSKYDGVGYLPYNVHSGCSHFKRFIFG